MPLQASQPNAERLAGFPGTITRPSTLIPPAASQSLAAENDNDLASLPAIPLDMIRLRKEE